MTFKLTWQNGLLLLHHPKYEQSSDRLQRDIWTRPVWTSHTSRRSCTVHCTPLAFSARAIGGAFGSAVLDAIINGKLKSTLIPNVTAAALKAGLPSSSVAALLEAMATGVGLSDVPGISPSILAAASDASHWAYAHAYRLAWASIIPFTVLALVAVICLKGVKELMTEKVEATVEQVEQREKVAL
jgi:hypothetical protein